MSHQHLPAVQEKEAKLATKGLPVCLQAANMTAAFNKAAAELKKAKEQQLDVGKVEIIERASDSAAYQQSEAVWACLQELQKVSTSLLITPIFRWALLQTILLEIKNNSGKPYSI